LSGLPPHPASRRVGSHANDDDDRRYFKSAIALFVISALVNYRHRTYCGYRDFKSAIAPFVIAAIAWSVALGKW